MAQHLGQRAARARGRQRAGRVVGAPALINGKAEELAKRRCLACYASGREAGPFSGKAGTRIALRFGEIADHVLSLRNVAAVSDQRVGRRPTFSGQHGKERFARDGHYSSPLNPVPQPLRRSYGPRRPTRRGSAPR